MDWLAEDLIIYFIFADNLFQHLVPYKDYTLDQFPGAFLVYLIPRLFTPHLATYILFFALFMAALLFIQIFFLLKKWTKTGKDKIWLVILVLSTAIIMPLSLMRFDLAPTILSVFSVVFLLRNNSFFGEVLLGLGTAVKIFPITLAPIFFVYNWQKEGRKRAIKGIASFLLALSLIFIPFFIVAGWRGIFFTYLYHSFRPIEVESLPASVLFLGSLLGGVVRVYHEYGSFNVSLSSMDKIVGNTSFALWGSALFFLYFWFYRHVKLGISAVQKEPLLVKGTLVVILVFIAFNKVFSPQYLIWPWPFVLWFLLYVPRRRLIILGSLWVLILFLTIINLLYFQCLVDMDKIAIWRQTARNVLYLAFVLGVFVTNAKKTVSS